MMNTVEILLLKNVDRLGQAGSIVQVKPGFARNYLLPRGLAVLATPEQIRQLEERRRQTERKVQRVRQQADELKRKLESRSLTLKLTLGEGDKPFGSITAHDLVDALKQEGFSIEKSALQLDEPIKALGIYDVPIRVHPEVAAIVKVWVVKA